MAKTVDRIIGEIRGTADFEEEFRPKACTVRLDRDLFCKVSAVAAMANSSMNSTLVVLIEAGIDEVLQKLTPEEMVKFQNLETEKLEEIVGVNIA